MHCRYSPIRAVLDGSSQEESQNKYLLLSSSCSRSDSSDLMLVFFPSPFYICGFCKHRLKAVANSKAHYLFNRVSRSFNRPLFIKQQHLRFEITRTATELQASGTSSNFQEIFRRRCASVKVWFLPFKSAPFWGVLFNCVQEKGIMHLRAQKSVTNTQIHCTNCSVRRTLESPTCWNLL